MLYRIVINNKVVCTGSCFDYILDKYVEYKYIGYGNIEIQRRYNGEWKTYK